MYMCTSRHAVCSIVPDTGRCSHVKFVFLGHVLAALSLFVLVQLHCQLICCIRCILGKPITHNGA